MKRILLLILFMASLASCSRPPISEGEYKDLIYEMLIVKYYVDSNSSVALSTDSLSVYGALLEKHGYTVDDFNATTDYYVDNPSDYAKLLKDVQARINNNKKEIVEKIRLAEDASFDKVFIPDSIPDFEEIVRDTLVIPADVLKKLFP